MRFPTRFSRAVRLSPPEAPARVGALAAIAIGLLFAGSPARAQNMDLGITGDATYAEAIAAMSGAEFVLYDYRNNPRPRVAGVVASLMEFATRNPEADAGQLATFTQLLGASFLSAADGDPELRLSANFLPALRFTRLDGVTSLAGLDTGVGPVACALLGVDVPEPTGFESLKSRMVGYDATRGRTFARSVQLQNMLVLGLMGHDLTGADNPELAGVLLGFLESEGYEPVPDGVDDGRFAPVYTGLAALPADYAAYMAAITVPMGDEEPPIWTGIMTQFGTIVECTDSLLAELAIENGKTPSMIEARAVHDDPTYAEQLAAEVRSRTDEFVPPTTIIAANALLMAQSQDPYVRGLAFDAQSVGALQGEEIDRVGIVIGIVKIGGGGAAIVGGIAAILVPGTLGAGKVVGAMTALGGFMVLSEGVLQIVASLPQEPSAAEVQIFEQIIAIRSDIENLRTEMHDRFDRLELQLNLSYTGLANALNALGNAIGELMDTVENLRRDVIINRALMERLEDALYGLAADLLEADMALACNTYLDYRADNGVDLPYAGAESFLQGTDEFLTVATTVAKNTALAGADGSVSLLLADETLNGASIGRQVNGLRTFPTALGRPALATQRIVAPAPWTQAAAAYVQFARENRWYFAYQYEQQTLTRGGLPDVEQVLLEGDRLDQAMVAGRSQALFDALFDGYNGAVADLQAAMDARLVSSGIIPASWTNGVTTVNPLAGVDQDVRVLAPSQPQGIHGGSAIVGASPQSISGGVDPLLDLALPDPRACWDLLRSRTPELWAITDPRDPATVINKTYDTGDGVNHQIVWGGISDSGGIMFLELRWNRFGPNASGVGCLADASVRRGFLLSTPWRRVGSGSFAEQYMLSSVWNGGGVWLRDRLLSGDVLTTPETFQMLEPSVLIDLGDSTRFVKAWMPTLRFGLGAPMQQALDFVCFDQYFPGAQGSPGACLVPPPLGPVVMSLPNGQVTITREDAGGALLCAVADLSTNFSASDAGLIGSGIVVIMEFDPPISAFCTQFGSLAVSAQATIDAFDEEGAFLASFVSGSTDALLATPGGFISGGPLVSRVEISTNDSATLVGAYLGVLDPSFSLGAVSIPGYNGPNGATVEFDFACRFGPMPDTSVTIQEGTYIFESNCGPDLDGSVEAYLKTQIAPLALNAFIADLQAVGSNPVKDAAAALSDWETLIEAYATFSLPFAMEMGDFLRAALGGSPATGELRMSGASILPICQRMQAGQIPVRSISEMMLERSALAQQEIDDALAGPGYKHAYLTYMLEEVRSLRDHVFDLAADDTYVGARNAPLVVGALGGLLANDVDQDCRTIEVDTEFYMLEPDYTPPQHGVVSVNADGSFTYTPEPGFVGTDRFNYRSGASVAGIGCQPGPAPRGVLDQYVFSNPADVLIIVRAPVCAEDINGDGIVNTADLGFLLSQFGTSGPEADLNGDMIVNTPDLGLLIGKFGTMCGM